MEPIQKESNQMLQIYQPEQQKLIEASKKNDLILQKRPQLDSETGEMKVSMPKRGKYRMRAHCNPLSDTAFPFPLNPNYVDWSKFYPNFFKNQNNQSIFI